MTMKLEMIKQRDIIINIDRTTSMIGGDNIKESMDKGGQH